MIYFRKYCFEVARNDSISHLNNSSNTKIGKEKANLTEKNKGFPDERHTNTPELN